MRIRKFALFALALLLALSCAAGIKAYSGLKSIPARLLAQYESAMPDDGLETSRGGR